jgi:deoxyribose-phosphate aldolase
MKLPIKITRRKLAQLIDHTNLCPDATEQDIKKLCAEAKEYGFGAVCVYPSRAALAVRELRGYDIDVCVVIGFPHGATTTQSKVGEALDALEMGATEFDMVINQGALKDGNYEYVVHDIRAVKEAVRAHILKVICENCNLDTVELKKAAYECAHRGGADFIKTSTGFGRWGAQIEDVRLMRKTLDELGADMGIKAAGGIHFATREAAKRQGKDEAGALEFLEAAGGYTHRSKFRIGASRGVQILESLIES